jgi:hypothetical protein
VAAALLGTALATLGAGCVTNFLTTSQAADFDQSVAAADTCLQASVAEVRGVETDDAIDEFLAKGGFKLEELSLQPRLSDKEAKAINGQFAFLASYATALKGLTSPPSTWSSNLSSLGSKGAQAAGDAASLAASEGLGILSAADAKRMTSAAGSVSSAVAAAGQAAVTLYGEDRAYQIAHGVDTDIQAYCSGLENVLCRDPDSQAPATGLAAILISDYEERLATLRVAFSRLSPSEKADAGQAGSFMDRRSVAAQYTVLKQDEADGVAKILALRKAIAQIASAHHAMAERDDVGFKQRIAAARDLIESLSGGHPAPSPAKPTG